MKFLVKIKKTKLFHNPRSSIQPSPAKKKFSIFFENFGQNTPFLGTLKIFEKSTHPSDVQHQKLDLYPKFHALFRKPHGVFYFFPLETRLREKRENQWEEERFFSILVPPFHNSRAHEPFIKIFFFVHLKS